MSHGVDGESNGEGVLMCELPALGLGKGKEDPE